MTDLHARPGLCHRRIVDARRGKLLLALWRAWDALLPKRMDHWAFFDHPIKRGQFIENARAVFEQVRHDPSVQVRVFVRGDNPPRGIEESHHVRIVRLDTLHGLLELARCGVFLLTNSTTLDMSLTWHNGGYGSPRPSLRRRVVVNLWHGIPLKRLFALANPSQRRHGDRDAFRRRERGHYAGLVASSEVDALAMSAIFHPIPPASVWLTGLPRTDFLHMPETDLPAGLDYELVQIRALRGGRRLVLYAPTYRDASASGARSYRFSDDEVSRLKAMLQRHHAVLGIRGHYMHTRDALLDTRHIDDETLLDLGHAQFHEIAPLLRESSVVVTDYSSVHVDALYLGLSVIGFAYDLDDYREQQNGLLYEPELVFPGPVTTTFDALLEALDVALTHPRFQPDERHRNARRLFFRHEDANNARRVVQRIHDTLAGNRTE